MNGRLGKYRIDGVLGKGAMGVVYKAFDVYIERVVALKTVSKEMLGDGQQSDLIGRFKNEAQAAGRLNHPNIVTVYDYGEVGESAYIAMEFVDGASLNALIRPGQRIETQRIKTWMSDLLLALQYAHSRGVIHRDIKPSNLMIDSDDRLKVSDFGIAHIDSSTLTQTGSIIGTPSYMSPEQFRGEPADARSDLFSAGIVLYQLLCGVRPFNGPASVVMHQILNLAPIPPSLQLAALGNGYDQVVERAIAKARQDRYPTAREFREALMAVEDSDGCAADTPQADTKAAEAAGAPPVPEDDDRTIVFETPAFAPDTSPGTIDTLWKTQVLPDVERLLSYQIGPIAKVLARKSMAQASSLDDLWPMLLPYIPSQAGQAQFQQAARLLSDELAAKAGKNGPPPSNAAAAAAAAAGEPYIDLGTSPAAPAPPETFDDAWAEAITQRLTILVGPIARVMVKRAALKTRNRNEFLELLAAHIESGTDRTRFLVDASAFSLQR